jgi:hypothetical protein
MSVSTAGRLILYMLTVQQQRHRPSDSNKNVDIISNILTITVYIEAFHMSCRPPQTIEVILTFT